MEKKRISLRGIEKLLSKKELQNVLGGSGWPANCPPGYHADWYYWWTSCTPDACTGEKVNACAGKSAGAECFYVVWGQCLSFGANCLHCSNFGTGG